MHPRMIGYCLVNTDLEIMSILNIVYKGQDMLPFPTLQIQVFMCFIFNVNYKYVKSVCMLIIGNFYILYVLLIQQLNCVVPSLVYTH